MHKHSPEEIVAKLRQAEAQQAKGLTIGQICQKLGVSEQTLHRWRLRFANLQPAEAKRLRELEAENGRLKRLVAELALDKQMLQELLKKKW